MSSNLRILLAEDNEVNQNLMTRILARIGYDVTLAKNGIQVLNKMDKQDYDIILMDIQMPEMDGITATKLIRAHYTPEKQPKIYALTAESSAEGKAKYLAAGMDGVLTKPVQIDDLTAILADRSVNEKPGQSEPQPTFEDRSPTKEAAQTTKNASSLNDFLTFDPEVIGDFMKLMGEEGQESARHLIELYKKDAPELIGQIDIAFKKKDQENLTRLLHTLKGSSSQVGARRMEQLCSRLEVLVKQSGIEPFSAFYSGIQQEYSNLTNELDLFLASLS